MLQWRDDELYARISHGTKRSKLNNAILIIGIACHSGAGPQDRSFEEIKQVDPMLCNV